MNTKNTNDDTVLDSEDIRIAFNEAFPEGPIYGHGVIFTFEKCMKRAFKIGYQAGFEAGLLDGVGEDEEG